MNDRAFSKNPCKQGKSHHQVLLQIQYMCQYGTCVSTVHVSVQCSTCVSTVHVSVQYMCQCSACVSTVHVSVQYSSCVSTVQYMCQMANYLNFLNSSLWKKGLNLLPLLYFLFSRVLLTEAQVDYFVVHLGGLTIDLFVGFLLFFDKTRLLGVFMCTPFHLMNSQLFSIGLWRWFTDALLLQWVAIISSSVFWLSNLGRC